MVVGTGRRQTKSVDLGCRVWNPSLVMRNPCRKSFVNWRANHPIPSKRRHSTTSSQYDTHRDSVSFTTCNEWYRRRTLLTSHEVTRWGVLKELLRRTLSTNGWIPKYRQGPRWTYVTELQYTVWKFRKRLVVGVVSSESSL